MCLSDFLRSQFGSPSGLFGSLFVAPFLNLTNIGLIRTSIELLEPEPDDRVLDVGFGGGYSLLALAEKLPNGRVVGVDHSPDMVVAAANLIQAKKLLARIRVRRGNVVKLPFAASTFDRVLTVNTIYYWPDLRAALREIGRVLKPGGRQPVAFRSPESLRLVTLAWTTLGGTNRKRWPKRCGRLDFECRGWCTQTSGEYQTTWWWLVNTRSDRRGSQRRIPGNATA